MIKRGLTISLIACFTLFIGSYSDAIADIDLDAVKQIESSGDPLAYNSKSEARGLYQITPICLREWNQYHIYSYFEPEDLFDPMVNYRIAYWYIKERIPQMLRYYDLNVNDHNILWAYNAGISRVREGFIPKETSKYIKKYKRIARRKHDH